MSAPQPVSAASPGGKSPDAFRTISEVASELDLPQHVLRFWETRFSVIRPLKRSGGRRYYRPEDVALLRRIRDLLRDKGYTIKGVQKLLRQGGGPRLDQASDEAAITVADDPAADAAEPASDAAENDPQAAAQPATILASLSPALRAELKGVLAELESLQALILR